MKWTRVLTVLLLVAGGTVLAAPPALAVSCDVAVGFRWAVGGSPSTSITSAAGTLANMDIRDNIQLEIGGGHNEGVFLWFDASNMVEYGWRFDRDFINTPPPELYDVLLVDGDQQVRYHSVTKGNHKLTIIHHDGQGRFNFRLDGATQSYHRDAIYTRGRPFTDGEIRNQCDGGLDRFWGLQYKPSASGSWTSWTSTHWNCDTQTDYGFRLVSNSEFRIYDAPDEFASYCDPFA